MFGSLLLMAWQQTRRSKGKGGKEGAGDSFEGWSGKNTGAIAIFAHGM
jgi:hypothetical protein